MDSVAAHMNSKLAAVYGHDLTMPLPRTIQNHTVVVEPGAPNDGYTVVYDVTWLFVPEAPTETILQAASEQKRPEAAPH